MRQWVAVCPKNYWYPVDFEPALGVTQYRRDGWTRAECQEWCDFENRDRRRAVEPSYAMRFVLLAAIIVGIGILAALVRWAVSA